MTKERGILMHARSVQNILAGRKTQTRRILTTVNGIGRVTEFQKSATKGYDWIMRDKRMRWNDLRHSDLLTRCPQGHPGDRLWVRETWKRQTHDAAGQHIVYKADGAVLSRELWWKDFDANRYTDSKWRPCLHMPRNYSRITLEITDVRVELVQDISVADIVAEGAVDPIGTERRYGYVTEKFAREEWERLWDDTNGKGAWDRNDWVWALTFKRVE